MRPGEPQTSPLTLFLLLLLMARGGEATTAELVAELEGCDDLEMPIPEALALLQADRFVLVDAEAGAVELSDKGWFWCGKELAERPDDELTEDMGDDDRTTTYLLYAFMNMIGRYLEAKDLSLAEFVTIAQSRQRT